MSTLTQHRCTAEQLRPRILRCLHHNSAHSHKVEWCAAGLKPVYAGFLPFRKANDSKSQTPGAFPIDDEISISAAGLGFNTRFEEFVGMIQSHCQETKGLQPLLHCEHLFKTCSTSKQFVVKVRTRLVPKARWWQLDNVAEPS